MFKILLVATKTGCSDERMEHLMKDSLSMFRFLGLPVGSPCPDRATIARYRSRLDEDTTRDIFELFEQVLADAGYVARDGQMLDATFALVPI